MSADQIVDHDMATARAECLARVEDYDSKAAWWEAEQAAAAAELEDLEPRVGSAALDDPEGADALTATVARLRERVSVAGRAAAVAAERAEQARREALLLEAAELDEQIAAAEAEVVAHEAKTERLLQALERHTGAAYIQRVPGDGLWHAAMSAGEDPAIPQPLVDALRDRVERLKVAQQLLRASAQGVDLRQAVPRAYDVDVFAGRWFEFDDLPESLRPGGLRPAAGFYAPAAP